jgi:hypothetical protein
VPHVKLQMQKLNSGLKFVDTKSRSHSTHKSPSSISEINIMAEASPVSGYQHDDAWDKNWLRVDDTHEIYYEQYGPKDGKPGTSNSHHA